MALSLRCLLLFLPIVSFLSLMVPSDAAAQEGDPSGNTSLRLIGTDADSISGGVPTVGIRSRTADELRFFGSNVLAFDPVLFFCCVNATYLRVLSPGVVVGGRLLLPVGLRNVDGSNDIIMGAGTEIRFHTPGTAPIGFYFRFSPTLYVGEYEVDFQEGVTRDFSILTFSGGIGCNWRIKRRTSFGLMFGVEKYFGEDEPLPQSIPFVADKSGAETVMHPHLALQVGHSW